MLRNNLTQEWIKAAIYQALEQLEYVEPDPREDVFGPVTENTLQLPADVQVHFIGDESSCDLLSNLVGKPVIGLDAEWRPNLTKFNKTQTAILQLSDENSAYLVDLIALNNSQKLNEVLTQIFQDEASLKVGLALKADLTRIQNSAGESMTFANKMVRYLDLGLLHQDLEEFKSASKTKQTND